VNLLKQYDEISKVFEELDTNDDHRVSFAEFKKGFDLLGEDNSDEESLRQEFDAIDSNDGDYILFDEVRLFLASQMKCKCRISLLFSSACIWPTDVSANTDFTSYSCSISILFVYSRHCPSVNE
jgi:hypothetical protein